MADVALTERQKEALGVYLQQVEALKEQFQANIKVLQGNIGMLCHVMLDGQPEGAKIDLERMVIVVPEEPAEVVEGE